MLANVDLNKQNQPKKNTLFIEIKDRSFMWKYEDTASSISPNSVNYM